MALWRPFVEHLMELSEPKSTNVKPAQSVLPPNQDSATIFVPSTCSPASSSSSSVGSITVALATPIQKLNFGAKNEPAFATFRELKNLYSDNAIKHNPEIVKSVRCSDEFSEESAYATRRTRNNAASKRSRDKRKAREHLLELRVKGLEEELAWMTAALQEANGCSCCVTSPDMVSSHR